jgi:hypothetical protein
VDGGQGFSTASKATLSSILVVPVDFVFPERAKQTMATLWPASRVALWSEGMAG